ncbi:DUF397 domain-containing protein [Streptomyces sp. NBC_00151]|uniref:DUF397 domain-containing protein n=1 Tax=Streptomyces sp. NBC_00151 TaxID=2975669 RepID=UPI002DDBFF67|nr:DUF397 domain-containing protein [Streptomyces sp. NBC_00151]WRZ40931.1 DUF397 domain-containing protein [Streptomyces sp. NBC_00151]
MPTPAWQKSSYCPEGNSCVHVAGERASGAIRLTESGDPSGAILTAAPAAFRSLLSALKEERPRD